MEILLYITIAFLFIRLAVAFINSITDSALRVGWSDGNDLISVLIPARDEEQNILNLLNDLHEQEYKNIEVIVLDDFSSDKTAAIATEFSNTNAQFKLIKGEPLPDRWLGKSWACHQLAQHATGNYFLFLDADVRIEGSLFSSALSKLKENNLALLSLFPGQDMKTMGEWLVVPLMHYLLLSLLPLKFIEWFKQPSLSAANGQFMLFNGEQYRQNQWHERVKNKVTEDIEIMKEVKRRGLKGATLLENNFIRCRMYHGFSEGVNGFRKNLLAGFGGNIIGLFLYLYLSLFSYVLFFFTEEWQLFLICAMAIVFLRSLISGMANQNPLVNVLLHIPQMVVMLYIALLSVIGKLYGTTQWKGRKVRT